MPIDPMIYARNLEVRLTATTQELQKLRARMQKVEQRLGMVDGRLFGLENDVADLIEPSATDLREAAAAEVLHISPASSSPPSPFSLKRRFQGKYAVQNLASELLTADLPKAEAEELLKAFEAGEAVLKPHQIRKEPA